MGNVGRNERDAGGLENGGRAFVSHRAHISALSGFDCAAADFVLVCGASVERTALPQQRCCTAGISGSSRQSWRCDLSIRFLCFCRAVCLLFILGSITLRAKTIFGAREFDVGVLIAAVIPLVAYYANALASSELLRVWSAQSQTLSPNPLHYLLTFAPYLLLAGFALVATWIGRQPPRVSVGVGLVVAALVYAPLGAQRRFLQGSAGTVGDSGDVWLV